MEYKLEKGEVVSIYLPDFGTQMELKISKWNVEVGSLLGIGDIICEIDSDKFHIEIDSHYNGKIISIINPKEKLHKGIEICKIEGL